MIVIAAFVVAGLLIGSFLNVVIARLPEGRSLVRPGSACPGCGAAIAWHDNVPVISFLAKDAMPEEAGRMHAHGFAMLFLAESTVSMLATRPADLVFVDELEVLGRKAKIRLWSLADAEPKLGDAPVAAIAGTEA